MVTISGGEKLEARLKEISDNLGSGKMAVRVGFLENSSYPDGTSVPMVAAVQEFGSPANNIPPRPFMRGLVAEKSGEWPKAISDLLKADDYDLEKTLALVGEGIAGQLRQSIADFSTPPNAPSTVKRKGFNDPLVDSGHLLQSVDSEVVEGDGED